MSKQDDKDNNSKKDMIFLSYFREDASLAQQVRTLIESNNIPVWQDITDMPIGKTMLSEIGDAISDVKCVVLLLTAESLKSDWVKTELRLAQEKGIRVFPILGDNAPDPKDLPRYFRKRNCVDLSLDENKNRLIKQLQEDCQTTRAPMMAESNRDVFVERPAEIAQLKSQLMKEVDEKEPVAITTAMMGTGGFGKTMLAQAICQDPEIQDRFDDGILWVTLGEKPDEQALLSKMGSLIVSVQPVITTSTLDKA